MRIFILVFLLSLVQSKKKYDYDSSTSDSSEESGIEYIPDVSTALDLRGNLRKLFALDIALQSEGSNVVCSPLSALLPLAKLAIGAEKKSKTEKELLDAIGYKKRNEIKPRSRQIIKDLEYLGGVEISLASRLYVSKKKRLSKKFKHKTQSIFRSAVELVDMNRAGETADTINTWVYEHTNKKIKQVISRGDINSDTSLILVNAIYFQGNWKDPFPAAHLGDFHTQSGSIIKVPLMTRTGYYNFIKHDELNAQIIEIPYKGEDSAMIIVLPLAKNALPILLRALKLSPELLNDALMRMKTVQVELTIPKFKIESSLDLRHYYSKMGVKSITKPSKSGLTRIVKGEDVFVSSAVQKAMIEVNEVGTEAAAATVISVVAASLYGPPAFTANHPFLFYVKAKQDQLFAGVVNKP